jgi:Protein of unknown function (DUF664)
MPPARTPGSSRPDRRPAGWRGEPVTLRWILQHLIEETARHNDHLDILREMADGGNGAVRAGRHIPTADQAVMTPEKGS